MGRTVVKEGEKDQVTLQRVGRTRLQMEKDRVIV
jgi:hypothetical protein